MLFASDPLFVGDLLFVCLCLMNQCLILIVNNPVYIYGVLLVCESNLLMFFVQICCFIQSVQKSLILKVFTLLVIHIVFIILIFARISFATQQLFMLATKIPFHFQVDNFRVVYTNGTLHCFLSHYLVDQVHGLLREFNSVNSIFRLYVGVYELDSIWISVASFLRELEEFRLRGA